MSWTDEGWNFIKAAQIVPEEMIDEQHPVTDNDIGGSSRLINPFGGGVYIVDDTWGYGDEKFFTINYFNLPAEACLELATKDWRNLGGLVSLHVMNLAYADSSGDTSNCDGGRGGLWDVEGEVDVVACPGGTVIPIPIPAHIAAKACSCEENSCEIIWGYN